MADEMRFLGKSGQQQTTAKEAARKEREIVRVEREKVKVSNLIICCAWTARKAEKKTKKVSWSVGQ